MSGAASPLARLAEQVAAAELLSWRADGACRGMDPALFYPDRGDLDAVRRAKEVCRGCAVQEQCLAWALHACERIGIWGGTSEAERRALRRAMGRQAVCRVCGGPLAAHRTGTAPVCPSAACRSEHRRRLRAVRRGAA